MDRARVADGLAAHPGKLFEKMNENSTIAGTDPFMTPLLTYEKSSVALIKGHGILCETRLIAECQNAGNDGPILN